MAIKAIFVGINKHLDTSIPELSGARRDATAMWVLFTDTVESLSARLLSVGVHNVDDLKNLDDDRLRHCVGSGTAALLRPKGDMAGAMLGEQGGDK